MKRLIAGVVLAVSATTCAYAQMELVDNPTNKYYLGVRAGIDVTSLQSSGDLFKAGAGFHAGIIYHMPIWKNLYFEPSLSLFYNSAGIKDVDYRPGYLLKGGKITDWGLRVPMNVGYRFDITDKVGISFFTGPNISLNLKSSYSFRTEIPNDFDIHFKGFDMGWNFGVGVAYNRWVLALTGTVGCTHYIEQEDDFYYARRNNISLAFGYNF